MEQARPTGRREDFDFLHGTWTVRRRKLAHRLVGEQTWLEFDGRTRVRPILGGLGNIDENSLDQPDGAYEAVTLRLFDPGPSQWSIWWIDARRPVLQPPVHGGFRGSTGTFEGVDVLDGRAISVRFLWSVLGADHALWEQAFSADEGKAWETNWVMTFDRDA